MKRLTISVITFLLVVLLIIVGTGCDASQKKPGKIAFTGKVVKTNFMSVFTMDTDGENLVKLEDNHNGWWSPDPRQSWSLDGTLYVYSDGGYLYVVGADGNDRRQIMDLQNQEINSFSVEGNGGNVLVAYKSPQSQQDGYITRIATIDTRTGKPKTIADVPNVQGSNAVFSPDSKKIAFLGEFHGLHGDQTDIYILNSDGTGLRKLTDFVITWPVPDYNSGAWPAGGFKALQIYPLSTIYWSPDSKKILTQVITWEVSDYEHITDIFVVDVTSGESTNLTNSPEIYDGAPAWSPDNKQIAYRSDRKICLMDSNGGNVRVLLDYAATPSWLPDGSGILFAYRQSLLKFVPLI